jgi:predicted DNA-binding protein (UPF0251 family)
MSESMDVPQLPESVIPLMGEAMPAAAAEVQPAADEAVDVEMAEVLLPVAEGDPTLWLYRDRTAAMLRRYSRLAVEVGRLPSLLGRELFRAKVTSYRVATFEDAVIFVHDVEQALETLEWFDQQLIARILLQDYTQEEVARAMGYGQRTITRRLPEALDRVSEIFLVGGLLTRLPIEPMAKKSCQGGEDDENDLSDCEQSENKF